MNDARQTSNEWSAMRHATVRYGCVLDDRAVVLHGLRRERERRANNSYPSGESVECVFYGWKPRQVKSIEREIDGIPMPASELPVLPADFSRNSCQCQNNRSNKSTFDTPFHSPTYGTPRRGQPIEAFETRVQHSTRHIASALYVCVWHMTADSCLLRRE